MRRVLAVLVVSILTINTLLSPTSHAEDLPEVLITELGAGVVDANKEFVELVNAGLATVDISGWKLYKRTAKDAASRTEIATAPAGTVLQPGARVVFASGAWALPLALPTAGVMGRLSDSGAYVQLVRSATVGEPSIDDMAWGTGLAAGSPAAKDCTVETSELEHAGEFSYKRMQSDAAEFIDTNLVSTDFCRGKLPTPGKEDGVNVTDAEQEVPEPEPTPEPEPELEPIPDPVDPTPDPTPTPNPETPGSGGGPNPPVFLLLTLSELLIDPAAPQSDDKDEFIELHNPNDQAVQAKNYRLEGGSSWQSGYILPTLEIPAKGYVTITSDKSPISLTNSGGQLRLLDPSGKVLETLQYPAAKAGDVWAKNQDGAWFWTSKATPSAINEFVVPTLPAVLAKTTSTKPKAPAKKAAATKKTAAKEAKPKAKKASETPTKQLATQEAVPSDPPNFWILGSAGAAALGYGTYEYRQDVGNFLRRFRRNKAEE